MPIERRRGFAPKKIGAVQRLRRFERRHASLAEERAHALTAAELLARGYRSPPLPRLRLELVRPRCRFTLELVRLVAYAAEQNYRAFIGSHHQVAELLGCSWASAQRAANEAEALGWIERHHFFVPDADGHRERPAALVAGPALVAAFEAAEWKRHAPGAQAREGAREVARVKWSNQYSTGRRKITGLQDKSSDHHGTIDHHADDPTEINYQKKPRKKHRGNERLSGAEHGLGAPPDSPAPPEGPRTREAPPAPPRRARAPDPAEGLGTRETLRELLARLQATHGAPP